MAVYELKANLNQLDSRKSSILTRFRTSVNDVLSAVRNPSLGRFPNPETEKSLSAQISDMSKLP